MRVNITYKFTPQCVSGSCFLPYSLCPICQKENHENAKARDKRGSRICTHITQTAADCPAWHKNDQTHHCCGSTDQSHIFNSARQKLCLHWFCPWLHYLFQVTELPALVLPFYYVLFLFNENWRNTSLWPTPGTSNNLVTHQLVAISPF